MPGKITIISATFPPEKGAAPSRIFRMAQLIRSAGYTVEVICFLPNYPTGKIFPGYTGKLFKKENWEGIDVFRIWSSPSNSEKRMARSWSMLSQVCSLWMLAFPKLLFSKPDLFIVNAPPLLNARTSVRIANLLGRKILLNVSDLWPLSALELGVISEGKMYRQLEKIEASMYRRADGFVCQSEEILKHIEARIAKPDRSFIYYNLQETNAAVPVTTQSNKRRIVYAGLLGVAQGVYEIASSIDFAALGTAFHIYGEGNEKEKIEAFVAAHPGRGVYYHGSISAKEVPAMLSNFQATIIPLKTHIHGALPSKVFMAAANELPVLFCGKGEGAEITTEFDTGWVSAPGDIEALKRNIISFVMADDTRLAEIRNNCRVLTSGKFNKEKQDAAFLQFLSGCLVQ